MDKEIESVATESVLNEHERHVYRTMELLIEKNLDNLKKGRLDLTWMNPRNPEAWGTRTKAGPRGLTWPDINRHSLYGTIPERATTRGFIPRGSFVNPDEEELLPDMGYDVLDKFEVWSDNVVTLYEEAKARQWNAAMDIPWTDLTTLPEDIEKAACQLATLLSQVEFVAGDQPAKWIWRIPNDFFEVKAFMASQLVDEARHTEVFRKRALANGGGLLKAGPGAEWALKAILDAPTHPRAAFILNVIGEGVVLSIFRAGEFLSHSKTDQEIFRRCMQDEARHVSYGTMQLKFYLDHVPNREKVVAGLHAYADFAERAIMGAFVEPSLLEPLAVLMGGGAKRIDQGMDGVKMVWEIVVEEYLQRCDRAGFSRRGRCTIPAEFPA